MIAAATPAPEIILPPLQLKRPLLLVGHGTRNDRGRQTFIDFAKAYQALDQSRPVVPCFLELTGPSIATGVSYCVDHGFTDLAVLPLLLFAARHNKFDVTQALDLCKRQHPQVTYHYGRHLGIHPEAIALWQNRLAQWDQIVNNPQQILRSETVLLFVGRGSSDPDANSDVYKMARLLWEGSGYQTVETCFIGITHPRLAEGFRRSRLYQPRRIVVLPYFLFTGTLMEKIQAIAAQQQLMTPEIQIDCLPEMGIQPQLLKILRERELETEQGEVKMNCEMCKFRLAVQDNNPHSHSHHHGDHQGHHHHGHHHQEQSNLSDPYADLAQYHQRIWQAP